MIVIKIGGNAIQNLSEHFFDQLNDWQSKGHKIIIIHGGGNTISKWSTAMGMKVNKINGIRVTDKRSMEISKAVLLGIVQPNLCQQLVDHQIKSTSLNQSGQPIFTGNYLDYDKYGEVGNITGLNPNFDFDLLSDSVGVSVPLAKSPTGELLNVNADWAATNLAKFLGADHLILLTDVSGVMIDHQMANHLNKTQINSAIEKHSIKAGMLPKIMAANDAASHGVQQVRITDQSKKLGTKII